MPYFDSNASCTATGSAALPDVTTWMLRSDVGVHVGVEHHAQRGGDQAHGLRSMALDEGDEVVDPESFEQRDATTVGDIEERTEDPRHVHERRRHDRDAGAEVRCVVAVPSAR